MPARLTSFELHGYKTFASRTQFEFADGITAIVGPNGSGKSNIADALRWVLGEQSYGLLRAKKTEDMIFAGSEHRPRAGMASATILFDNSDGWLPIDFAEVGITRRAYRDGENEYLLNGQRVRLKDVSELLSKSGLAERTYTVIGQGLVDAALALKAEDRRKLFEEAAGIGLHRSRREEALRRLETTHRNIERVEDILAELQPRLKSLERQAKRALEYEQVRTELRGLLREWYGYHWHQAQADLQEAQTAAHRQEGLLSEAQNTQFDLDQKLAVFRAQIHERREELAGLNKQLSELHHQREETTRQQAVNLERTRSLNLQIEQLDSEKEAAEVDLELLRERLRSEQQEAERLKSELDETHSQKKESSALLQSRMAERQEAEAILRGLRQSVTEASEQEARILARLTERKAQVRRQRESLRSTEVEITSVEDEIKLNLGKVIELKRTSERTDQQAKEAEGALEAHLGLRKVLDSERKQAMDELAAQQARLMALKAQQDVLEQAEANLTGYAEGAQLLLRAMREDKLEGAKGALNNHLEVPGNLETAISAALGDFLEAVVVNNEEGVDQAIDLLEEGTAKGVLLPLEMVMPGRTLKIELERVPAARENILGVASSLVKTDHEMQGLIDALLGRVLLVNDRATAKQLLASRDWRNLADLRIVTLNGEVFYASGAVIAGVRRKGALNRPRMRKDIQAQVEDAQEQCDAAERDMQQVAERTARHEQAAAQLSEQLAKAKAEQKAANKEALQAELKGEKYQRDLQWRSDQKRQLEADIARGLEDEASLEALTQGLHSQIAQQREEVRVQNETIQAIALDELQTQNAYWEAGYRVAEGAVKDAQKRVEERKGTLERAERLKEGLHNRYQAANDELAAAQQQAGELEAAGKASAGQLTALQAQIAPIEKALEEAERGQNSLLTSDAAARQGLRQAEHSHAQAKIQLARRQESLESMRRRIEDDFGLVSFEYVESVSGPKPLPLGDMVEELPHILELPLDIDEAIQRQRAQIRRMGAINQEAQQEYKEVKERFEFLSEQVADLRKAETDIQEVITELDLLMEREFKKTFEAVAQEFREIFTQLFGGGSARLVLTDPESMTETGIDIEARLPGRREQGLALLSGGERSLAASALVFALLRVSPTPFCILDEVDAMLDEANVGRFRDMLAELSKNTQFIIITHNRNTVQAASVIYGVTMDRDSASQVISLKLDEVSDVYGV